MYVRFSFILNLYHIESKKSKRVKPSKPKRSAPQKRPDTVSIIEGPSDFRVQFKLPQLEGKIVCGDGQSVDFIQSVTMRFRSQQVCRIETKKARGIYVASAEKSVVCSVSNGGINCQ